MSARLTVLALSISVAGALVAQAQVTAMLTTASSWPGHGPSMQGINDIRVFTSPAGTHLYGSGDFRYAGTTDTTSIARWNGSSWEKIGPTENVTAGIPSTVRQTTPTALEVFDDGNGPLLYFGGAFDQVNGSGYLGCIGRFDGTNWSSIGLGTDTRIENSTPRPFVADLCVHDDGTGPALYAVGNFRSIDGVFCNGIARYTAAGWSVVGTSPISTVYPAFCVSLDQDGSGPLPARLHVFTRTNGQFIWNGTSWATGPVVPTSLSQIRKVSVADPDGSGPLPSRIYVTGQGVIQKSAAFDGTTWTGLPDIPFTNGLAEGCGYITAGDNGDGWGLFNGTWKLAPGATSWEGLAEYPAASCVARGRTLAAYGAFVDPDGAGPAQQEYWVTGAVDVFKGKNLCGIARLTSTGVWLAAPEGDGTMTDTGNRPAAFPGGLGLPAGIIAGPSNRRGGLSAPSGQSLFLHDGNTWQAIGTNFAVNCEEIPTQITPVVCDGEIVFGARRYNGEMWVVDPVPGTIVQHAVQELPGADRLIAIGSFDFSGQPTSAAARQGGVWSPLPPLPEGFEAGEVVATPTRILVTISQYISDPESREFRILELNETGTAWNTVLQGGPTPELTPVNGKLRLVGNEVYFLPAEGALPSWYNFGSDVMRVDPQGLQPIGEALEGTVQSLASVNIGGTPTLVISLQTGSSIDPAELRTLVDNNWVAIPDLTLARFARELVPFPGMDGGLYAAGAFQFVNDTPAGTFAILSLSQPGSPCSADINNDNAVTADDIFAFLDTWFAQNGQTGSGLTADFNADQSVTADDIFAFLDAWFAQNGNCQ